MKRLRLGAVAYLNARPLVHGLDKRQDVFALRFDPPSCCAVLLHEDAIDVGMIPAIEYCRGPEYRIVPGMAIISKRTVASVALFTKVPVAEIRTIAADTSSRTSNALLRILCAERFGIQPEFQPMAPDPDAMFAACDAALIIGDPALYLDPAEAGVEKIDLGEHWTDMTGLPFVWAFWAGRPGVVAPAAVRARNFWVTSPWTMTGAGPGWLPVGGANEDRWVSPSSVSSTAPCTSPIVRTGSTATVRLQVPDCGVASVFVARTTTV